MQDGKIYVEAFGETWMQFNDEHAIDMGLLNGRKTSSSYVQLSPVVHFLHIFLTWA
jgi:hypothetical protein